MDTEVEKLTRMIFPGGVPENLEQSPELLSYLNKLGSYKTDQLKKEQTRLAEECKLIVEQTQDLAISNYKTFISTAENSRSIFNEFKNSEQQVDILIEKLPKFSGICEEFLKESSNINAARTANSNTLKNNAQILEILELPQLMERCIREDRYEEALELASYVQKIKETQGHMPVISTIVKSVEGLWHTMLVQLVAQLRTDLQLPKCLQIVGYLKRMQAFSNDELRLKFLQARNTWFSKLLKEIPTKDAQHHLTKTIEITRINLFSIITQYQAIFPEDQTRVSKITTLFENDPHTADSFFHTWLHSKIYDFLNTLENDLQSGVHSIESVLEQCMYFGLSFSRIGADFRTLMGPIFKRAIQKNFKNGITKAIETFNSEFDKYTLINNISTHTRSKVKMAISSREPHTQPDTSIPDSTPETFSPPESLLDFHPLAILCNGFLSALNDIRLCAPVGLAAYTKTLLELSFEQVAQRILTLYRQEQQAFSSSERETFIRMCTVFAYDFIPYIQQCIHAIFPQLTLNNYLRNNLFSIQDPIVQFDANKMLEPLKHLLPTKVDVMMKQEQNKNASEKH